MFGGRDNRRGQDRVAVTRSITKPCKQNVRFPQSAAEQALQEQRYLLQYM